MAADDAHRPVQTSLHATFDLLTKLQPSQDLDPHLAIPHSLLAMLLPVRSNRCFNQSADMHMRLPDRRMLPVTAD